MKRFKRSMQPLSESIWRRLNMYAVAAERNIPQSTEHRSQGKQFASASLVAGIAVAGGTGMLALAPLAEAEIVYTPVHVNISVGNPIWSYHPLLYLDLNHDGIYDFRISNTLSSTRQQSSSGRRDRLTVSPVNKTNQVWGVNRLASALSSGVQIGANSRFKKSNNIMLRSSNFTECNGTSCKTRHMSSGAWRNVENRYLGLRFIVQGKIHYGWARLTVTVENRYFLTTLTGFAYETVPDKPIVTGKTSDKAEEMASSKKIDVKALPAAACESATLGRLARGASGLAAPPRCQSLDAAVCAENIKSRKQLDQADEVLPLGEIATGDCCESAMEEETC
jgi:hypothetical protein